MPVTAVSVLRSFVAHVLVVALIMTGPGMSVAFAQATSSELDARLEYVTSLREAADGLDEALPSAYFARDDLAFDLAFEPPAVISAWVADEIAFQAYRGVLRGADGTLRAGAGNAWDQALLLASLLSDAGSEARIASATVDEAAARSMVEAMVAPVLPALPREASRAVFAAAMGQDAADDLDEVREEADRVVADLRDDTNATASWLVDRLASEGIELGASNLASAVADARDYAWIQYRVAPEDPWTDVHPAAPEGVTWTHDLVPERYVEGGIPADLQHRLRFQAVVERRLGSTLETAPVMNAWERPSANLSGVALSFTSVPDGLLNLGFDVPQAEAFEATNLIVPFFNAATPEGGQLFDLAGNVVPPDAAASPAAGVFQNVGNAFGNAAGGLTGEDEAVALTGYWLEFTLVAPGGEETSYRRMIVDRLGPERRASGDPSGPLLEMTAAEQYEAMLGQHTFMLAPGRYAPAFVAQQSAESLREGTDFLAELYRTTAEDPSQAPEPPEAVSRGLEAGPLLRLYDGLDEATLLEEEGYVVYRPSPSLVVTTASWNADEVRTDIVHNERRAFQRATDVALDADPERNVLAGVWETLAEGFAAGDVGERFDVPTFFAAVEDAGIEVVTLVNADEEAEASLALPAESRAAIARDLEQGYVVLAPTAMPEGVPFAAWWRVDPSTGETLGRGADGRGISLTEYNAATVGYVVSGLLGAAGFGVCVGSGGGAGCCMVDGVTAGTIGWLIGAFIAEAFVALAVSVTFDMASFTLGAAGALPTWCDVIGESPSDTPSDTRMVASTQGTTACRLPGWGGLDGQLGSSFSQARDVTPMVGWSLEPATG